MLLLNISPSLGVFYHLGDNEMMGPQDILHDPHKVFRALGFGFAVY